MGPHKHQYKTGDKVQIKSYEWFKEYADKYGVISNINGADMNLKMAQYCGQILTIEEDYEFSYKMKDNDFIWTDGMIECKVGEEITKETTEEQIHNDMFHLALKFYQTLF